MRKPWIHFVAPLTLGLTALCGTPDLAAQSPPSSNTLGWDYNRRYDQNAYLEAHNSYASVAVNRYVGGPIILANQEKYVLDQLRHANAVRSLDLRYYLAQQLKYGAYWNARVWCDPADKDNIRNSYDTYSEALMVCTVFNKCRYDQVPPQIVMGHHAEKLGFLHLGGLLVQPNTCISGETGFANGINPQPGIASFLFNVMWWLSQPENRTEIVTINTDSRVPPGPVSLSGITGFEANLATRQLYSIAQGIVSSFANNSGTWSSSGYSPKYTNGEAGRQAGLDLLQNHFDNCGDIEECAIDYTYLEYDPSGIFFTNILPILIFRASPDQVNYGYPGNGRTAFFSSDPAQTPLVPRGSGLRVPRPGGLRPAPDKWGTPGWWLPMDGYPTLRQLVDNRMRLVVLPDGKTWDNKKSWADQGNTAGVAGVKTNVEFYGFYKNPVDLWTRYGAGANKTLFMMENSPDETVDWFPLLGPASRVALQGFTNRVNQVVNTFRGIPNFMRVDMTTEYDSYAAAIRQLNGYWAAAPKIDPIVNFRQPEPNAAGWHNRDVLVGLSGNVNSVPSRTAASVNYAEFFEKAIVRHEPPWGNDWENPLAHIGTGQSGSVIPPNLPGGQMIQVCHEGKSVISFSGVDSLGPGPVVVGDRGYADVWIDRVKPTISGQLITAPNANGWYKTDVVANFTSNDDPKPGSVNSAACGPLSWDQPVSTSGIDQANTTPTATLKTEGIGQTLPGKACDKAGNCAFANLGGLSVDKTPPTVTLANNLGRYSVDQMIAIQCVVQDNLSKPEAIRRTCPFSSQLAAGLRTGTAAEPALNSATWSAIDLADNYGQVIGSFSVFTTPVALANLTRRYVTNPAAGAALLRIADVIRLNANYADLKARMDQLDLFKSELLLARNNGAVDGDLAEILRDNADILWREADRNRQAGPSTAKIVLTYSVTREAGTNDVLMNLVIANTGHVGITTNNVTLNTAKLNNVNPLAPALPLNLGDLAGGQTRTVVIRFPKSVGAPGAMVPVSLPVTSSLTNAAVAGVVRLP